MREKYKEYCEIQIKVANMFSIGIMRDASNTLKQYEKDLSDTQKTNAVTN